MARVSSTATGSPWGKVSLGADAPVHRGRTSPARLCRRPRRGWVHPAGRALCQSTGEPPMLNERRDPRFSRAPSHLWPVRPIRPTTQRMPLSASQVRNERPVATFTRSRRAANAAFSAASPIARSRRRSIGQPDTRFGPRGAHRGAKQRLTHLAREGTPEVCPAERRGGRDSGQSRCRASASETPLGCPAGHSVRVLVSPSLAC